MNESALKIAQELYELIAPPDDRLQTKQSALCKQLIKELMGTNECVHCDIQRLKEESILRSAFCCNCRYGIKAMK